MNTHLSHKRHNCHYFRPLDALAQYANGLINDYVAVRNSLVYTARSNGPVEGWNSRIKMLLRRGGGRSGLELLNAYTVLSG